MGEREGKKISLFYALKKRCQGGFLLSDTLRKGLEASG